MIEFLLKNALPSHFCIKPQNVTVPIERKTDSFTEVDDKACADAYATNKYTTECSICDHVVLRVNNNNHDIDVVRFEKYIEDLPKKITDGKRCDLLMTDGTPHNKIVFCDLCCYDEKYIGPNTGKHPEGKCAFARKQMEESVKLFLDIDVLNHYILTFPTKICLFAYRSNTTNQPILAKRGDAESNMQAMLTTASSMSGQIITENTVMNHNFTFVQNKYPSAYNW